MAGKNVTASIPTPAVAGPVDYKAEFERLTAENAALKAASNGPLSLKVSEKGAVSVYGLGRFPVTLYREQWEKLIGTAAQITAFIAANTTRLKVKGQDQAAA
jgi:hypothetical protein